MSRIIDRSYTDRDRKDDLQDICLRVSRYEQRRNNLPEVMEFGEFRKDEVFDLLNNLRHPRYGEDKNRISMTAC